LGDFMDRRDEAVAVLGKGFDEAGTVGRIAEKVAQPGDGGVQQVVVIDENIVGPQPMLKLLASPPGRAVRPAPRGP
jgi:hypothetical protein